jgi:hypothetical protein
MIYLEERRLAAVMEGIGQVEEFVLNGLSNDVLFARHLELTLITSRSDSNETHIFKTAISYKINTQTNKSGARRKGRPLSCLSTLP